MARAPRGAICVRFWTGHDAWSLYQDDRDSSTRCRSLGMTRCPDPNYILPLLAWSKSLPIVRRGNEHA
jgi:hypothetical protein